MNEQENKMGEVTISTGNYEALLEGNIRLGVLTKAFQQAMELSSYGDHPVLNTGKLLAVFEAVCPISYQLRLNDLRKEAEDDQGQS